MAKKGRRPPPGSGGIRPQGLGSGQGRGPMPDVQQLMQQAVQMQTEMQQRQAELAEETFEATAGGGVVSAVVKGSGEVVSVTIDPMVLDPDDPEMVGDLVVAAINQAMAAAHEEAARLVQPGLGGLDLGDLGRLIG